jgi:hypothetical protein
MRKWLYGGGIGAALIVVIVVAYAFLNLTSIVAANRDRILKLTSDALGRPVFINEMRASLGWGVSVEITDLRIADDPVFSQLPFLTADEVSLRLKFFPLLFGRARFRQLDIVQPEIRVLRNARGELNLGTLGNAREKPAGTKASNDTSALARLAIKRLNIDGANIIYNDLSQQAKPIKLHGLDLSIENFRADAPFDVSLKFGFLGRDNVDVHGKVGPLLARGAFLLKRVPADLSFALGSFEIDKLRKMTDIGKKIPAELAMPDPISVRGSLKGPFNDLAFEVRSDLTRQRVAYAPKFDKPAGVVMMISAQGTRQPGEIKIASAEIKLATLDLRATKIAIAPPALAAQVDSNAFGLGDVAALIPAASSYGVSGRGELHGTVKIAERKPTFDGAVVLYTVGIKSPPGKLPPIANLSSTIRYAGTRATVEPTTFMFGSSHMSFNGNLDSITPLNAVYSMTADSLRLDELHPGRPAGEVMNQVAISGTATGAPDSPQVAARIASPDGTVNRVTYQHLNLDVDYNRGRLHAHPLQADVFGGSLVANVNAVIAGAPSFGIGMKLHRIDLGPALRSQNISAANWVHGLLTGNVSITGRGTQWPQIKPTLSGRGALQLVNGKLIGVNIVALAINGVAGAPGVSQLLNATFMSSHSGMLADPDTELTNANLSFVLSGPRITTHDLTVQSQFYGITGDGWFDMDKNIDMDSDIQLTFGLSVAIPVWVKGQLPAVIVLPNLPKLTERVAMGAISAPGRILKGGMSAVGSIFGGGSSSNQPQSNQPPSSLPNPLKTLKSLIP